MEKNFGVGFTITLIVAGLISVAIYCRNGTTPLTTFGIASLIAGCATSCGCLIGFIFGIPKLLTNNNTGIKSDKKYIGNDNLVQISDWLTKIIVGVGLTNLNKIPSYLKTLGSYLGEALGIDRCGEVVSVSISVYFLICGFLISYLWTRLTFGKMLEDSEQLKNIVQ
jgi:ABC-type thiamin/hydroxymethylpyrimidine transport system permease subunit